MELSAWQPRLPANEETLPEGADPLSPGHRGPWRDSRGNRQGTPHADQAPAETEEAKAPQTSGPLTGAEVEAIAVRPATLRAGRFEDDLVSHHASRLSGMIALARACATIRAARQSSTLLFPSRADAIAKPAMPAQTSPAVCPLMP